MERFYIMSILAVVSLWVSASLIQVFKQYEREVNAVSNTTVHKGIF